MVISNKNALSGGTDEKCTYYFKQPQKNGNSQMLCEAFKKGVEESGNFAKLIRLAEKNIGYCKGCDFCMKNDGVCVQKDDMSEILDAYKKADVLVLATPYTSTAFAPR